MTALVKGTGWTSSEMSVIKRGIAKDCNDAEFNLYIQAAKQYGLDPFRKQIIPVIFSKKDAEKRNMTLILTRDGYRCIASRCGNYRPKSKPASFVYDESLVSALNPKGIVSVSVELSWQDKQGQWHPVIGEAYWDEYAPVEKEWKWNEEKRKRLPTGNESLTEMWAKMPRNMIEKCAESQALRAGWPEEFSNLYGEEEMAKAIAVDLTASEMAEQGEIERREKAVKSAGAIGFNFGEGIKFIPVGEIHASWDKFIEDNKENWPVIEAIQDQNREPLREFWAKLPTDALDIKAKIEAVLSQAEKTELMAG